MVAPGPIDTGMLKRSTGTDERKAGLVANVPLKRVRENQKRSLRPSSFSRPSFITGASYLVDGGKTAQ